MHKPLRLPITNVYGKGDYSAVVHIGSEQTPVNLLLDTGSSTLVVQPSSYLPEKDKNLKATPIAQEVNYGIGGWNGPVINSSIILSESSLSNIVGANIDDKTKKKVNSQNNISLNEAPIALVSAKEPVISFGNADGILGLAYHHLNKGFNLTSHFTQQNIKPEVTYPWPFAEETESSPSSTDLKAFKKFLWQYPEHDITPYFTELEQHHIVANKFAFYSKRSSVLVDEANKSINLAKANKAETEPLNQVPENQGLLILGGGEEQTDLYQGEFQSIKVEHDVYYNVELVSIQVGDMPAIKATPLEPNHVKSYFTNAIIDTGAAAVVLTAEIYQQLIQDLIATNADFAPSLDFFKDQKAQYTGIDSKLINLDEWPNIYFNFTGEKSGEKADEEAGESQAPVVQLTCAPQTYWQTNTPAYGRASFKFLSQLPQWPNQTIVGLPLINNYYVVFDRSEDKTGVVKFAKQK